MEQAVTARAPLNSDAVAPSKDWPTIRWLECAKGQVHLLTMCPKCGRDQDGILLATFEQRFKGRVSTRCLDCSHQADYYVDGIEKKVWMLQPMFTRGGLL